MIYLDYNATAVALPAALEAVDAAAALAGNAASLHGPGQRAHRAVERAREAVRRLVGAALARVVLTSGGTEADNLALHGLGRDRSSRGRVILGGIEHPAVVEAADRETDLVVETLPVGPEGRCEIESLSERLAAGDVALVALMLANNETGVLQPVAGAARACRAAGVPLHVDAVQAAGKVPIRFDAWGVSSLAISAHKFGGPRGVGAWVVAPDLEPRPLFGGGEQQGGLRPGTIPAALAAGLAVAADNAAQTAISPHVGTLRDRLEAALAAVAGAFVVGRSAERLPNTCAVGFEGVGAAELVAELTARGVYLGAGAACHAGESKPSRVLTAMGIAAERAVEVIRISLGPSTSQDEVDTAVAAVIDSVHALRGRERR